MSKERTASFLLRLYPAAWRARYGAELESLILETSGGSIPWSVRLNVAAAALCEQARTLLGFAGRDPRTTLSRSLPTMLWAWLLVTLGGGIVGKASEHWGAAVPQGESSLPANGFDVLVGGAIVGSLVMIVGALIALPAAVSLFRSESRRMLLRPAAVTVASSATFVLATVALASWAHGLTSAQRNGHDDLYVAAFIGWALLAAFTLATWTYLGARIARLANLPVAILRVEALLAAVGALAMCAVTIGAALWWAGVADTAPWFLSGGPQRSRAPVSPPRSCSRLC